MVRESSQTAFIPGCTVKDFFEILYADSSAARAFHKEVDKDENTKVDPWNGSSRTVHFTMPMQLPAVIKKLIGSDSIPVKEVQCAETDSTGALIVTSTPLIGVPGGSKFQAVAKLAVSNTTEGGNFGCRVDATVICTASGPWGLVSTIEGIMVDQSVASVGVYLHFCKTRCRDRLADRVPEAILDGQQSPKSDATVFEQFFDAQEALSRSASMNSTISEVGANLGPSTGEVIDTVALLKLLECLEGRIGLISSDLAALKTLIPASSTASLAVANAVPLIGTSPSSAVGKLGRSRLGYWLTGVSCGAGAVLLCSYLKTKHSRSYG